MMDMLLHQMPPNDPTLHHPVYVLSSERDKYMFIDSLTISEIENKILDLVDEFNEDNKSMFQKLFSDMKKDKKKQPGKQTIFFS